MTHVDEDAMKQEFCNLFHTIMEGYKMVNEAYLKFCMPLRIHHYKFLGRYFWIFT